MTKPDKEPAEIPVEIVSHADGHAVRRGGRPLKTPAGHELAVPTRALAEALAAEWRASGARPRPEALPLTRMASTALDRIARHRAEIERQLLAYAETELLCHRADAPRDLVSRQHESWQPLLDWLAHRHDALLAATTGILARPQNPASLAALEKVLAGFDHWRLAAVSVAVAASGSLVVGLALVDGRLDASGAFDVAELDATYQIEKWGEDAEAAERRAGVRAELELAERFLALLAA